MLLCDIDVCPSQALKVLKTAEFMPFVVFIAAPELDTLRAMHKAVIDAGLTTKLLTVSSTRVKGFLNVCWALCFHDGKEKDCDWKLN